MCSQRQSQYDFSSFFKIVTMDIISYIIDPLHNVNNIGSRSQHTEHYNREYEILFFCQWRYDEAVVSGWMPSIWGCRARTVRRVVKLSCQAHYLRKCDYLKIYFLNHTLETACQNRYQNVSELKILAHYKFEKFENTFWHYIANNCTMDLKICTHIRYIIQWQHTKFEVRCAIIRAEMSKNFSSHSEQKHQLLEQVH